MGQHYCMNVFHKDNLITLALMSIVDGYYKTLYTDGSTLLHECVPQRYGNK